MGASTLTYTIQPITVMGNKRVHKVKCVISNYGTDGIIFTAALAGLSIIDAVIGIVFRGTAALANGPVVGLWDETNALIRCLKASNSGVDATTAFDVDVTVMGS